MKVEKRVLLIKWKPVRLINPPKGEVQFSDYYATYYHEPHKLQAGHVPKNFRPNDILDYFDPIGCLRAYHYFLPQHEVIDIDDPNAHIFIPDIVFQEYLNQKIITKNTKLRLTVFVTVLDCSRGFPSSEVLLDEYDKKILLA